MNTPTPLYRPTPLGVLGQDWWSEDSLGLGIPNGTLLIGGAGIFAAMMLLGPEEGQRQYIKKSRTSEESWIG